MYEFYSTCSKEEQAFIRLLFGFYDQSIDKHFLYNVVGKECNMSVNAVNVLLNKLIANSFLYGNPFLGSRYLDLMPRGCLFSLIRYVKEETKPKLTVRGIVKKMDAFGFELGETLEALVDYLLNGKIPAFDYSQMSHCDEDLLREINNFPEFSALLDALPAEIIDAQYRSIAYKCLMYLFPTTEFEAFYQKRRNHPAMTAKIKKEWADFHFFLCSFLKGDLSRIPDGIDLETTLGRQMYAYTLHLKGDITAAISWYEKAIEIAEDKSIFTRRPVFAYSHALALVQDNSPESQKKIAAYLKNKEFKKDEYALPHLIFTLPNETDETKREKMAEQCMIKLFPADGLGLIVIAKYFGIFQDALDPSYTSDSFYKLLALEASSVDPEYNAEYATLSKEVGYPSLISHTYRLEEWEKVLNALNNTVFPKNVQKGGTPVEEGRIIYELSPKYLNVTPVLQKSKDGVKWTKGRNIALERFAKANMPEMNDVDRQVAACVKKYKGNYYYGSISYEMDSKEALWCLAGYPWVFLAGTDHIPVAIIKGIPEMVLNRTKSKFTISMNIDDNMDSPVKVIVENDTRIIVMRLTPKQREVVKLLNSVKELPQQAEEKLKQLLGNLNGIISIQSDLIDTTANLKTVKADARITVQLIPMGTTLKAELFVKPLTTEPPYCKAGQGAKSIVGTKDGERVQMLRNFKTEKANAEIVSSILQEVSGQEDAEDSALFDDAYSCLELLDALHEQSEITLIEWPEGAELKISRQADLGDLSLSLKGKNNNWFEMEGELNIGAHEILKIRDLLSKLRQSKGRFIQLGENEFLALSERLRKRLKEIDTVISDDKGKLKVQQFATVAFDKLGEGIHLEGDKSYKALKDRIAEAEEKTCEVPKQLNGELRDYQLTGFRWMARLSDWGAGACLADDMGLGKTIESIAMLLHKAKEGASLVISPASVLLNWQTEITKFAPALNVLVLNMAGGRADLIEQADTYDVVLSTYGLLVSEAKELAAKRWNVIILDEAHTIKNRDTKTSKAAMKLDGAFRLILTGTPIQNHLGEIWNLFQFINPGLLGSIEQFADRFVHPITQQGDKEVQKRLKRLIAPFMLRRTKNEVLDELPEKTEIIKEIELSKEEMSFYELLRRQTENSLANGEMTPLQALSEITRLRQAACNAVLVDKKVKIHSSKEETFMNLVDELVNTNHRALVFSQFTSHLALIRKALDKEKVEYLYLDGSTPVPERTKLVKEFQTGGQPLFLISLKAGGLGLNLTAADYVIHLDPWWNPAVEDQASDRAYRIGQKRPVTVFRLIAKHTIEEKIIRLHATKKDMADSLLEGSNMAHKLTREELLELLK